MGYTVVVSTPGTTPGGFTRSLGDLVANNAGTSGGKEDNAMDVVSTKQFFDKAGAVCEIGRGLGDTDITFIALKNENGNTVYAYPNAAGNGWIFPGSRP